MVALPTALVIQILVSVLALYFMLFSIIHRICNCIENVEKTKAIGKVSDALKGNNDGNKPV